MDFHALDALRQRHPAWKLLTAKYAPLIVSFLHRVYVRPNVRTLSESALAVQLEDYIFRLRQDAGEEAFPRSARGYLEDWASDECAWLRKYYVADDDEPHFDITSDAEQAIDWLANLGKQAFIGTESRLLTVFELLRQLAEGTETDPQARIAALERRRAQIDQELARIKEGQLPLIDATGVRERFLQIAGVAQALLSDFRAVDQNFRDLDRAARERIAAWEGGKGDLLAEIFGERDAIAESDQGRSFRAFWDFLMSPARQEELSELLERVFALPDVRDLQPDRRILRIHYDWLAAGETTQRTVAKLSSELRRYLDDKAWIENRRIMEILHDIENAALKIRRRIPDGTFTEIDETAPELRLIMDRPLFEPPEAREIEDAISLPNAGDIPTEALFEIVYVDKERLATQIRRALERREQISLPTLVENCPLEQGLAELVAYLSLASEDSRAVIDDAVRDTITWTDSEGRVRMATLPRVIFARVDTLETVAT